MVSLVYRILLSTIVRPDKTASIRPAIMSADSSSLDPPEATQPTATQSSADQTSLPTDIRQQVEQEQALADAQKRLKELEEDNEKIKREKKSVEDARDEAGAWSRYS